MTDYLDPDTLLRWCVRAADELRLLASEIDAMNVFPVPDADTGTNMALTMAAAATAAESVVGGVGGAGGLAEMTAAMREASLAQARGNSGLILSQLLAGFADALGDVSMAGPADLANCLERGAELAYAAVAEPVEGTILSVARAAATAGRESVPSANRDAAPPASHGAAPPASHGAEAGVSRVAFAAARAAAHELARTPLRLRPLAVAGVVDAGGRGLLAVLAALVYAVTGRLPDLPTAPVVRLDADHVVAIRESGSDSFRHEVCYLLDAEPGELPALRRRLASAGDSVVIAGDGRLWRVHVHVQDIAKALEAARTIGEPSQVVVSRLVTAQPASQRAAPGRAAEAASSRGGG